MKNNIINILLILGLYLWLKFIFLFVLLLVDVVGNNYLSEIFYFIFDYGLLILALTFSLCCLFLTKCKTFITKIYEALPKYRNYFISTGWIPIALLISNQFMEYSIYAIFISIIVALIIDKQLALYSKLGLILILSIVLIFMILGN